jgi:hypothetical protein
MQDSAHRTPDPEWSRHVRFVGGALAILVLSGIGIYIAAQGPGPRTGLTIAAAICGGFGTLTQAFLAADGGPNRRETETAKRYAVRMKRRDTWEVLAWAALSVGVVFITISEMWPESTANA